MSGQYDDDIYYMASIIGALNAAVDIGLTAESANVRSHIRDGDIFDWLQLVFPPHFDFSFLDQGQRMIALFGLQEAEKFDRGGMYWAKQTGLGVMISYAAYIIGKKAQGQW